MRTIRILLTLVIVLASFSSRACPLLPDEDGGVTSAAGRFEIKLTRSLVPLPLLVRASRSGSEQGGPSLEQKDDDRLFAEEEDNLESWSTLPSPSWQWSSPSPAILISGTQASSSLERPGLAGSALVLRC